MKPILKIKIAVDAAMSVSMLLLMAYGLVGEAAHEWIGMGMFALFVAHHILNRRWIQAVPQGRYTPQRSVQTALAGLIFLCMVGSMFSGIVLSRHVFAFLPKHGGYELAGKLHILCAFWGFVLMSLHLGMHWNMLLTMARKRLRPNQIRTWVLRIVGYSFAVYGAVAFVRRDVGLYLLLKSHFVFFDYSEPLIAFLLDCLAVMGLFVAIGFCSKHGCLHPASTNGGDMSMGRRTNVIALTAEDRKYLEAQVRIRTNQTQIVNRSRILLLRADGHSIEDIADKVGINRKSVMSCLKKYNDGGVENALHDGTTIRDCRKGRSRAA